MRCPGGRDRNVVTFAAFVGAEFQTSVLSHRGFGVVATLARAWEHRKQAHFPRSGDRGYPKIER